jgi:hypothetical protein
MYARSFSASAAPSRAQHDERLALPGARHPSMRPRFTLLPMPNAKQVRVGQPLADEAKGLRLDADVAVGDDDDRARHLLSRCGTL